VDQLSRNHLLMKVGSPTLYRNPKIFTRNYDLSVINKYVTDKIFIVGWWSFIKVMKKIFIVGRSSFV
jgi:hypothetical protein